MFIILKYLKKYLNTWSAKKYLKYLNTWSAKKYLKYSILQILFETLYFKYLVLEVLCPTLLYTISYTLVTKIYFRVLLLSWSRPFLDGTFVNARFHHCHFQLKKSSNLSHNRFILLINTNLSPNQPHENCTLVAPRRTKVTSAPTHRICLAISWYHIFIRKPWFHNWHAIY